MSLIIISLIIPILATYITWKFFPHKIVPAEVIIPLIASLLIAIISKFAIDKALTNDTEYWSNGIKGVTYYEPYTTWVNKTCSRTYSTGYGKHRRSHTVYYDCSYCDENNASYAKIDDKNGEHSISYDEYVKIKSTWTTHQQFVELNRDIDYSGNCGKDGDAFYTKWDGRKESAYNIVSEHTYENRIQAAHTVFDYKDFKEGEAKKLGLYDYPSINGDQQISILGHEQFKWYTPQLFNRDYRLMSYIDGKYGPLKQCKTFVLLFKNKPLSTAFDQEAYWEGANKNEFILCISMDDNGKLQWVKSFGWSTNKRVHVDAREEIMNQGKYDFWKISESLDKIILPSFERKQFTEFNYITVEPPFKTKVTVVIIIAFLCIAFNIWSVKNDLE